MKTNMELKEAAWRRLWADKWFGRLFGGALLLGVCGQAVQVVLGGILRRLGVQSWFDYMQIVAQNRHDLTTPIPILTTNYVVQATSSTVLTMFFSFLMAGIVAYGGAVILRKCLANDESNWLGEAFGGFKYPFGMLWLVVRFFLILLGWGLLAIVPLGVAIGGTAFLVKGLKDALPVGAVAGMGALLSVGIGLALLIYCVPFYRYRFLWLVKAENPEQGASACLRACRALMKGNLMKSFRLDCSYWKPITLLLLLLGGGFGFVVLSVAFKGQTPLLAGCVFAAILMFVASIPLAIVLGQYLSVGQGFLYLELKGSQEEPSQERKK